jgi:hypothetical protein
MEALLIIGTVVISGLLCFRQDIYKAWIFFVNLSFSIYIALFIAPFIAGLIPELPEGIDSCKLPAVLFLLALILVNAFYKLTETVSLKSHEHYPLPAYASRIGGMFFGGLSGTILISFLFTCSCMMPFSQNITDLNRNKFADASNTTLKLTVKTLNFFSMQRMSREAEECFKKISAYNTAE